MLLMAKCPDAKVVYIKTIAAITDTGMPITIVKNSGLAISVMGEAANNYYTDARVRIIILWMLILTCYFSF